MVRVALFLSCLLSAGHAIAQTPSAAAASCDLPTDNAWLNAPVLVPSLSDDDRIEAGMIHPVRYDLAGAIGRLEADPVLELSSADVLRYLGDGIVQPAGARPFLVRGVYPAPHPRMDLSWSGDDLYVFAGGLGCAPFVKQPLVVFLERRPRALYVSAMSAI